MVCTRSNTLKKLSKKHLVLNRGLMNQLFRKANMHDIVDILIAEREYMIEHEPDHLDRWDGAINAIKTSLQNSLERMVICEIDGKVAGHSFWNTKDQMANVNSIFVRNEYRRMGIAKELLAYIEKDVKASDYSLLTLETLTKNPAQHLFDKSYTRKKESNGWIYYEKNLKTT